VAKFCAEGWTCYYVLVTSGDKGTHNAAISNQERDDWPEYFPPFLGNAVQVAPNGQVWVLQASASDDAAPTYDIFDAAGKLTSRVQLAKRSRVVGFGSGTVYVVRSDEDDLQYLQRYRLE